MDKEQWSGKKMHATKVPGNITKLQAKENSSILMAKFMKEIGLIRRLT
jgi:hypothetical protein